MVFSCSYLHGKYYSCNLKPACGFSAFELSVNGLLCSKGQDQPATGKKKTIQNFSQK